MKNKIIPEKIVFAETKSKYYFPYQNFFNPLKRNCKKILSFDTRANYLVYGRKKMNKMFLDFIKKEKPDYVFTWVRCDEFYLSTFLKTRKISPETKIILYFGDDNRAFEQFSRYYILFLDYGLIAQKKYVNSYIQDGIKKMSHVVGLDTDFFKPLNIEKKYDVTFIGLPKSKIARRHEIIKFLKDKGIKIKLFGAGWEDYRDLEDIYEGPLEAEKMVEVINQSKINLCLSRAEGGGLQLKGKVFEAGACKTFVLTEYCKDYLEMFEEGKELVMFKDKKELLQKIKYYLKNESQREKIAENSYKKIIKNYSLDADLQKIFTFFKNKKDSSSDSLPELKGKVISLNKKDFSKGISFVKEKIKIFDFVVLSDGKAKNLEFRNYLQKYCITKTKKPISCCSYYLHKKFLGDLLHINPFFAFDELPLKQARSLLDPNQFMAEKKYFLENFNSFRDIFYTKDFEFISKENTSFVGFPLVQIYKRITLNTNQLKKISEPLFVYKLFSLLSQRKLALIPYLLLLTIEGLFGNKSILAELKNVLKRKDKNHKAKELLKK